MPTSADRMAMRSLAPSPHIPTFSLNYPVNFENNDLLLYCSFIFYFSLVMMRALFSGDILANSFMFPVSIGGGYNLIKALSTAIGNFPSF